MKLKNQIQRNEELQAQLDRTTLDFMNLKQEFE
jgi:hypothetical protein